MRLTRSLLEPFIFVGHAPRAVRLPNLRRRRPATEYPPSKTGATRADYREDIHPRREEDSLNLPICFCRSITDQGSIPQLSSRVMASKRKAANATKAAPATRRPAKKAAAPPVSAEGDVQPPAAKRQRLEAGHKGRSRSDAAKPTTWPELADSESFQSELVNIHSRTSLSVFLERTRESDVQKYNLINANLEAFSAMLPPSPAEESDVAESDDEEVEEGEGQGNGDGDGDGLGGGGGGGGGDSGSDDGGAAVRPTVHRAHQTALPRHAKLHKWSPQRSAWTWVGCRGGFIRVAEGAEIPNSRKTAAAKAAHKRTAGGTAAKPAASAVQPSPSKMSAKQVSDELLRRMRGNSGDGVQHRQGEVANRSTCNIKDCRNPNAIFGCMACKIDLCSPECYSAHLYDNAELAGKCCATFKEISRFKQKTSNPKKGRPKAAAPPPTAAPLPWQLAACNANSTECAQLVPSAGLGLLPLQ